MREIRHWNEIQLLSHAVSMAGGIRHMMFGKPTGRPGNNIIALANKMLRKM